MIHRKFISEPLFQNEKKSRKDTAITNAEVTPKNRHCLDGTVGTSRYEPIPEKT